MFVTCSMRPSRIQTSCHCARPDALCFWSTPDSSPCSCPLHLLYSSDIVLRAGYCYRFFSMFFLVSNEWTNILDQNKHLQVLHRGANRADTFRRNHLDGPLKRPSSEYHVFLCFHAVRCAETTFMEYWSVAKCRARPAEAMLFNNVMISSMKDSTQSVHYHVCGMP